MLLGEGVGVDRLLVKWAITQRAARWFLMDQHRSLAERARAFAHLGRFGGLVGHGLSRSGGAVVSHIGGTDAHLEPVATFSPEALGGFFSALALASRHVGVNGLVLPAVLPLVVHR